MSGTVYLITGGTGFVGRHVVDELLAENKQVTCLCRPNRALLPEWTDRVKRVEADFSSEASLSLALAAVGPCDELTVVNLAALYSWWQADVGAFQRANVDAVHNLLAALQSLRNVKKVKLVQVSTVLAYGRPAGRGLTPESAFDEDCAPGPTVSEYARSKAQGDAAAVAAIASGTLKGCVVYLACCLGRDPKLLDPSQDVMRIKDLVEGTIPATISSEAVFTYVYVKDAARAIVAAANLRGNERGTKYLVGNQRLRTSEYYQLVAEVSGTPAPRFEVPAWVAQASAKVGYWVSARITGRVPTAPPDLVRTAVSGNLLFDGTKAQRELGVEYTPVRTAIEEAVAFVRASS